MMAWEMNPKSSLNVHSSNTSWKPPLTSKPPDRRRPLGAAALKEKSLKPHVNHAHSREAALRQGSTRTSTPSSPPPGYTANSSRGRVTQHCTKVPPAPSNTTSASPPPTGQPKRFTETEPHFKSEDTEKQKQMIQNPTNCLKNDLKCPMAGCS